MSGVRINKYLAQCGICSRREADRLLQEGRILKNGETAKPGDQVEETDRLFLDGKEIPAKADAKRPVLLAFYKPRGIVCTTGNKDRALNVVDYIGYPERIYPIGRLDKDSEGLLLLTNQGELSDAISRARNGHEKEYEVTCRLRVTDACLKELAAGVRISVPLRGGPKDGPLRMVRTKSCRVERIDGYSFRIILTQGYNRQIRRMCAALGNEVVRLKRVRIMNILLGNLAVGEYRPVEGAELILLKEKLKETNLRRNL